MAVKKKIGLWKFLNYAHKSLLIGYSYLFSGGLDQSFFLELGDDPDCRFRGGTNNIGNILPRKNQVQKTVFIFPISVSQIKEGCCHSLFYTVLGHIYDNVIGFL